MYYGAYPPYPQTGEPQGATPPGPVPWPPPGVCSTVSPKRVCPVHLRKLLKARRPVERPRPRLGGSPKAKCSRGKPLQAGAPQGPAPSGAPRPRLGGSPKAKCSRGKPLRQARLKARRPLERPPAVPGWVPQGQVFQGQVPQAGAPQGPAPYGAPPAVPGWVPPSGYQPAAYPMVIPACDPRKRGASSTINRMGLLSVGPGGLVFYLAVPLADAAGAGGGRPFSKRLGLPVAFQGFWCPFPRLCPLRPICSSENKTLPTT